MIWIALYLYAMGALVFACAAADDESWPDADRLMLDLGLALSWPAWLPFVMLFDLVERRR